jgi:hypothetical protein
MIANIFGILVLVSIGTYLSRTSKPPEFTPMFNIQDGKQRSLQARGDAGLYIEKVRRRAIKTVGLNNPQKLKETFTQSGSSTGVLETFLYSV